ncbi:MAG: ribosome small subunit-dependent GTPase A [Chloroflexi bacterium]|nr:ribosome small subunit-dependent GTPase A [Chloroflexota bacterium]
MTKSEAGLVVRSQAGYMTVKTDRGEVVCRVRGRLRRWRAEGDLVAVGDNVRISRNDDGSGNIDEVLPRKSVLARQLSGVSYDYKQIILANPDQVLLVFAVKQPDPRLRMLDRFLVVAERAQIPAVIIVNKVDLVDQNYAVSLFAPYEKIGYRVIYASAYTGERLDEIRGLLPGKITTLAGPSGVGKTSLLNAIKPGLAQLVGSVSQGVGREKGKHTTQVRQLFELSEGGYLADVPGMRTLALWDIKGEELDAYFREIARLVPRCKFNDCTHSHEPGCAVREAVETGEVSPARYDSYLRLRFGHLQDGDIEDEDDFED